MRQFQEHIAIFGRTRNLVGILTQPTAESGLHKPAVIILNSGVIHRVGHHRMYVVMARKLAAAGHLVLRFDLSGIGDSASRSDSLDPTAAALADISEALNWLAQTRGVNEVLLLGLCSGADIALRYGHADSRVVGLMLLDPTIPPTWHFYRHYIRRRVTNIKSWHTFLRGRGRIWGDLVERLGVMFPARSSSARYQLIGPQSREELEALFGLSIERGLKLLAVFSGNPAEGRQAYKEQLIDAFPALSFGNVLTLYYFEGCDHTFTDIDYRDRLNERVLTWLQETKFQRGTSKQYAAREFSSRAVDVATRRAS